MERLFRIVTREAQPATSYELPEDAYEQLAETKIVSCPVCHSSLASLHHKCEPGYCYWAELAQEEKAA